MKVIFKPLEELGKKICYSCERADYGLKKTDKGYLCSNHRICVVCGEVCEEGRRYCERMVDNDYCHNWICSKECDADEYDCGQHDD